MAGPHGCAPKAVPNWGAGGKTGSPLGPHFLVCNEREPAQRHERPRQVYDAKVSAAWLSLPSDPLVLPENQLDRLFSLEMAPPGSPTSPSCSPLTCNQTSRHPDREPGEVGAGEGALPWPPRAQRATRLVIRGF